MDDIKLLEAVERYINGEMSPDERVYFEQLRKSNPEVDQLVVEHTFFLHQMDRFDQTRSFKSLLNDTHLHLAEKGAISSPRLQGKARVVFLFNKYKRTAAIAASIAGITALTMSAMVWSISPAKHAKADIIKLDREINALKNQNKQQNKEINNIKQNIASPSTTITYTTGGTGFLIDPDGYLVTNAHVIENARHIAIQNTSGKDLKVTVVYKDLNRDLAILKITDTAFKAPNALPYGIRKSTSDIAEQVFTLGYPRNDIVYGDGYLAAKTGYDGDTLTCQIAVAANPGNSGGPIINKHGEVIGILSTKQAAADGAVFAIKSKYIHQALQLAKGDTAMQQIKLSATSSIKGMDRIQQVKKITEFVYMVKVN